MDFFNFSCLFIMENDCSEFRVAPFTISLVEIGGKIALAYIL